VALGAAARPAGAQLFGLPVVQSPFPGGAFAVALDGGSAGDGVRVGALAIAARRPQGRLAAALGAGRAGGFDRTRTTLGARLAYLLRFGESGAIALAPFAGLGSVARGDSTRGAAAANRLTGSLLVAPAGVGVGYRREVLGRVVAVHVSPQAQLWRLGPGGGRAEASTAWYGRVGAGLDVALARQVGVSVAYEAGGAAARLAEGPRPNVLGVAVSYAPRRRR
jgi:hypothetical protein